MWKLQFLIVIHISILYVFVYPQNHDDRFFPKLKLTVNDSSFHPDSVFIDDILQKVQHNKINYTISGVLFSERTTETKIRIPQTFNRDDVIKQCVLYYYMLDDEKNRQREILEVYPFFVDLKSRPWILVKYQTIEGLNIWIYKWESIPSVKQPSSIEAEIYNQVIDLSYQQAGVFDSIDVKTYEKIAKNNSLDISVIQDIYKKVLLWQKSQ